VALTVTTLNLTFNTTTRKKAALADYHIASLSETTPDGRNPQSRHTELPSSKFHTIKGF